MNVTTFLRQQWDRVGAWFFIAGGAVVLFLGYLGISGTPHVAAQLPYLISGGLFGIFLLGVGGLLWISADLRDEWRELRGIRNALERAADLPPAVATQPILAAAPSPEAIEVPIAASTARPRRRRATVGEAQ